MRTRLVNVVLLATLLFFFARLWLFLSAPAPALPEPPARDAPTSAAAVGSEAYAQRAADRPEGYDLIVARDLFSPTRGVVPPAPVVGPTPEPKPPAAPKLTLYGVVIIDGEKAAYLVEGSQDGRPRKVREHEPFAGGVVNAIRADGVTFLFGGSEIAVPLRSPKPGVAPLPAPGRESGTVVPQPARAVAFPRRQMPARISAGQLPTPSNPMGLPPGMSAGEQAEEPAADVFGDENPMGEPLPEGMEPDAVEEEQGY